MLIISMIAWRVSKAAEIRRKSLFPQLFDEKFEILYRCYEDVGGKI